jgi:hypothetical protein
MITTLYKNYFQKSKAFLFPALGIRKGPMTTPLQTYTSWDEKITNEDNKLICVYNTSDTSHWLVEQKFLVANALYERCEEVPDKNQKLYIFNLDMYHEDLANFRNGNYSRFSLQLKEYIISYYGRMSPEYMYMETFLFPEHFHELYADLLNVSMDILCEVYELANKPDMEKESLRFVKNNLENLIKNV